MFNRLLFLTVAFLLLAPVALAVSVSVNNVPSGIDRDQEFEVDIVLTCSGCTGDSFLRGVFYPDGTNYFGFTQNKEGAWINTSGSNCTQYYKIAADELHEGSWSGKIKVKPDSVSSDYEGPGQYFFKIGRYTPSCSGTWSSETALTITGPAPTATPAPTDTPTKTPTKTPTQIPVFTSTPTPAQIVTKTPTPTTTKKSSSPSTPEVTEEVLGDMSTLTETPVATVAGTKTTKPIIVSLLLVGVGMGLLSGVFVWQKRNALMEHGVSY